MPAKNELKDFVISQMGESANFNMRRAYIEFCSAVICLVPIEMFKRLFFELLITYKDDKIAKVRSHFVESLIVIKPFFDRDEECAMMITEIITTLISDPVADVAETSEQCEFLILQNRKKFS